MAQIRTTRRLFLQASGAAAALSAASRTRVFGANESLRVAAVGVGGKGWSNLTSVAANPAVQIAALCDIDEGPNNLGRAADKFPQAQKLTDWRRLLDKAETFDAIIVATPDHMHAPISLEAMQLGKHVFCEKPLTHTVFEARQMQKAAARFGVVTQMGNQIQSHETYRTAVKLVHDGIIGKVREVHCWQSGERSWLTVDDRPPGTDPVPASVHWDEWLGVAAERPFKKQLYHPFRWRAWQDFGTGQLGDFGCHILDPVFMALGLTAPLSVQAEAPPMNREVWNAWSTIHFTFPGTPRTAGTTIPLTWYDGTGKFPPREALGIPADFQLPRFGSVLIGDRGSLLIPPSTGELKLFPEDKFVDYKIIKVPSVDHYIGWADACRGIGLTSSPFAYSGLLTETVLLGTIAIRYPREELRWNSSAMKFADASGPNNLLTKPYRQGWEPAWI